MAIVTYVNVGVNSVLGTNSTLPNSGTLVAKSYAYDEAQYTQTDPINAQLGLILGTTSALSPTVSVVAYTAKQVRSITIVPTTAETNLDFITLSLFSMQPQVFGTATGTLCYNIATQGGTGSGAVAGSTINISSPGFLGTVMGTGVNQVSIRAIVGNGGTGVGGATGTQAFGLGTQVAYNPCYVNLAGATATIVVLGPVGTNTQAGYVFPTGPNGGLSMSPGDVFTVGRGTFVVGIYQFELECTFTPGGSVTR